MYVLLNCDLVNAVMSTVGRYHLKSEEFPGEVDKEEKDHANKHSSVMGNAVLIAQV